MWRSRMTRGALPLRKARNDVALHEPTVCPLLVLLDLRLFQFDQQADLAIRHVLSRYFHASKLRTQIGCEAGTTLYIGEPDPQSVAAGDCAGSRNRRLRSFNC